MSFPVLFYTFAKKVNSTKQPSIAQVSYQCELKASSSCLSPQVILNVGSTFQTDISLFNYCYIAIFHRYYYITNWTWSAGVWIADLTVDALASWKTDIGNSNIYALRASNTYNENIIDTMYPTSTDITTNIETVTSPFNSLTIANANFVVGIINNSVSSMGAVTYYIFTQDEFTNFKAFLFGNSDWLSVDDVSNNFMKAMFNPFQYIVSCEMFTFDVITGTHVTEIPFGWWTIPVSASRCLVQAPFIFNRTVSLEEHPQATSRGNYLNFYPYTRNTLYFNPFGVITIDTTYLYNQNSLYLEGSVDPITGMGVLDIKSGSANGPTISRMETKCSVSIEIATMTQNYMQVANGTVGAIADLTSLNFGGAIESIASSLMGMLPQLSSTGTNGGITLQSLPITLVQEFFPVVNEDFDHKGRPLCEVVTISDRPGFLQALDGDIDIACTQQEAQTIKAYLEGGFFYE